MATPVEIVDLDSSSRVVGRAMDVRSNLATG